MQMSRPDPITIAVAGKGGTGKTTISALIIRYLIESGKKPVLAVDADPNANLHLSLGLKLEKTIGDVLEEMKEKIEKLEELPGGMTKTDYINYELENILLESKGFDLLTMGRPEGPGCYCFANSILRTSLDILSKKYEFIVIDNEAGMEHLNRKTTRNVDILLIISDPTIKGIKTAKDIYKLTKSLRLKIKNEYICINRSNDEKLKEIIKKETENTQLNFLGFLPEDSLIEEYDTKAKSLIELPENSKIFQKIKEIAINLGLGK